MCINREVSIGTFVLGTVFNIITCLIVKDRSFIAVSIVWEFVLLMQVFEAMMWSDQNCGELNKKATTAAFTANVLQPVVVFLSLLLVSKGETRYKTVAAVLLLLYLINLMNTVKDMEKIDCVRSNGVCKHLGYKWWDKMNSMTFPLYLLCIVGSILLLLRPSKYAYLTTGYILLTLLVAMISAKGGAASMWCWLAAFAPLFNYMFWKSST